MDALPQDAVQPAGTCRRYLGLAELGVAGGAQVLCVPDLQMQEERLSKCFLSEDICRKICLVSNPSKQE